MTEEEQLVEVRRSGWNIEFIDHPSEAVCWAAMENCKWAIQFITDPSEALQLAAVKQDGWAVEYIKNPSEVVQLAAVNQNCYAIGYIKHPTHSVIKVALTNQQIIDNIFEYGDVVRRVFKNNAILTKKWLRYGEVMREEYSKDFVY